MKKKIITKTLIAVLAVSSLAGCGKKTTGSADAIKVEVSKTGYPVVNEQITLKAIGYGEAGCGEWEDFPILQEIENKTNVNINWQTLSGDGSDEKLNLIMASKELPDVIFSGLSSAKISDYAKKGY